MAAPVIQNALNSRGPKSVTQAFFADGGPKPRRLSTMDRLLIDVTRQILSDLEQHILPVAFGRELLTTTTVEQIERAQLSALIVSMERELVECGLLDEPSGVSYYLEILLRQPVSPTWHRSMEERCLVAMRVAHVARDLWESIQRLRRSLGPQD
jgi:hypothetical protein